MKYLNVQFETFSLFFYVKWTASVSTVQPSLMLSCWLIYHLWTVLGVHVVLCGRQEQGTRFLLLLWFNDFLHPFQSGTNFVIYCGSVQVSLAQMNLASCWGSWVCHLLYLVDCWFLFAPALTYSSNMVVGNIIIDPITLDLFVACLWLVVFCSVCKHSV